MPEIPTMSLKTVAFTPAEFRATVRTPKQYDPTILEHQLAAMEARQNKAQEAKSQVDQALASIEMSLYGKSEEQNKWWAEYKQNIKDQMKHQLDIGEYGQAIRTGTDLASSIFTDSSVIGRLKASKEYSELVEAQRKRIGNETNGIDQATFDWWLANNQYNYNQAFYQGQEVQGSLANIKAPVNPLRPEGLFSLAAKMVEEEQDTRTINNSWTNADGNTGHNNNTDAYHRKNSEAILTNVRELLNRSDIRDQLIQQFEVDKWQLKQLQDKYNSELSAGDPNAENTKQQLEYFKNRLYRNGQPIENFDQWIDVTIEQSPYAESLAYDRKHTVRDTLTVTGSPSNPSAPSTPSNNNSASFLRQLQQTYNKWRGAPVLMTTTYNPDTFYNAVDGISGLLNGYSFYELSSNLVYN